MVEELQDLVAPPLGQVVRDAADAVVVVREARAAELLDQVVDRLPLADAVEHRREGADVHRHGADRDEVAGDAAELAAHRAEVLGAQRDLELEQPLAGDRVALVGEHRGDVVDAVGVGHEARVADDLADLLDAAVQVADVGDGGADHLAVGLDEEVDDAVGGGVLRTEVEDHLLGVLVHAAQDELVHVFFSPLRYALGGSAGAGAGAAAGGGAGGGGLAAACSARRWSSSRFSSTSGFSRTFVIPCQPPASW